MKANWTYKVILIGSPGVGKSSFIKSHQSLHDQKYSEDYSKTIGTNFYIKKIPIGTHKFCHLQFWDLKISEDFYFVIPSFFGGASAFVLFFDTSNYSSFSDLSDWMEIVNSYSEELPIFLVGTKTDLHPEISLREILELVHAYDLFGPFFTSIKEKSHSEIIFNHIAEKLTGIPILSRRDEILNEMREQFNTNCYLKRGNEVHRVNHEEDTQNNLALLQEIIDGSFTSPKVNRRKQEIEGEKELGLFMKYFKYCPVCHQENHKRYLQRFFLSKDPLKQSLRESLLELIQKSEEGWNDRIYYNKITLGIPCCNCFDKFFKKE
jgi:GTPase SAR1 family protein